MKPKATGYSTKDTFEAAKGAKASGGASNKMSFKATSSGGTTTASTQTTNGGSTNTTSVSTGNGNVSASRKTEAGGGSQAGLSFPKGLGLTVSVDVSNTSDVKSEGGYTTATTTSKVTVSAEGEVQTRLGGIGGGKNRSEESTYQLMLKDEDWARLQRGEISQPSIYDPTTIPVGGSVMMDSSTATGTQIEANYRNMLKTDASVTETRGVSTKVDRVSDSTARVTVGPTDAIENEFNASIGVGPVSVGVGATKTASDSRLKTAEFDLSTPEGRAAYDQFIVDGTLPTTNGPGVANVADVQILHGTQALTANGSLGPLSGETTINANEATVTITTPVDGPKSVVTDATFNGNTLHVEQSFNGDVEDRSKFKATITLHNQSEAQATMIYTAITGDPKVAAERAKESNGTVTITLNAEQAQQVQDRAKPMAVPPGEPSDNPGLVDAIGNAYSPYYVAVGLAGGSVILNNGGVSTPGNFDLGYTLVQLARDGGPGKPTPLYTESEPPPQP